MFYFFSTDAYNVGMFCNMSIISLVFICIFSSLLVLVPTYPVYAGEQIVGNAKNTDQVVSRDGRDDSVKVNRQQEFSKTKGPEYTTTNKDPKPQGPGYLRIKPKLEDDSVVGPQKVFDVEFMDETSGHKMKKDSDGGPYVKFERIEDPEKNNILIRKATEKDYKTELSMGYRLSPYSAIYLGKGFLVERKDNFNVDPRDNGWRIKFKFDF
jgi:hypothetical protein